MALKPKLAADGMTDVFPLVFGVKPTGHASIQAENVIRLDLLEEAGGGLCVPGLVHQSERGARLRVERRRFIWPCLAPDRSGYRRQEPPVPSRAERFQRAPSCRLGGAASGSTPCTCSVGCVSACGCYSRSSPSPGRI